MKRVALVVGVNRYQDSRIHPLQYAEEDADQLWAFLRGAGYEVTRLRSPNGEEILDAAYSVSAGLEPGDLFLFFFAGHGSDFDGRQLLLGANARLLALERGAGMGALRLDVLKDVTSEQAGLHRVFLFDCCRDDLRGGGRGAGRGMAGATAYRNIFTREREPGTPDAPGSIGVLLSCGEDQKAQEIPELGQGIFSGALLALLSESRRGGAEVKFSEDLKNAVARRMNELAAQHGRPADQRPTYNLDGESPVLLPGRAPAPSPSPAPAATAPPVAAPPPLVVWHMIAADGRQAQVLEAALASRVASGEITRETLVWKMGMIGWQAAGEVADIAGLSPPPLPCPWHRSSRRPNPTSKCSQHPPAHHRRRATRLLPGRPAPVPTKRPDAGRPSLPSGDPWRRNKPSRRTRPR